MVFNDAIESDQNEGFVPTGKPSVNYNIQKISYTFQDTVTEQDFDVLAFHTIAHGDLYISYFMWLPEVYQSFKPVMQRIASTWHTTCIIGDDSSNNAFNIESQIININGCTNQLLASNLNVNPTYEHYNSDCGMWMNGP